MLEFINFRKYYYNVPTLDIPAFAINTGIHLLKGSNGSGKTTLLRSLAGLLKFEGDIKLDNISLKDSPLIQRKLINYSEADQKFPPFLTGLDFIKLFCPSKAILCRGHRRDHETPQNRRLCKDKQRRSAYSPARSQHFTVPTCYRLFFFDAHAVVLQKFFDILYCTLFCLAFQYPGNSADNSEFWPFLRPVPHPVL